MAYSLGLGAPMALPTQQPGLGHFAPQSVTGLGAQPSMLRPAMGLGQPMATRPHFADGGGKVGPGAPPGANLANMVTGGLQAPVGGRTDHLPISVPPGSYVLPADVVSALGQGNTQNGIHVIEGTPIFKAAMKPNPGAKGVDIMAAGGEFVVPPDVVARIGNGNMQAGHRILDKFVKMVRSQNIKTLKSMPGPARSSK